MTKFYLVRHGETEWNHKKILMGQSDIPLNSLGETQIRVLPDYFQNIKIDFIYSSDLSRAYSTAVPISNGLDLEIFPDKRLRECSAGNLEGLTFPEMQEKHPDEIKLYQQDEMSYEPPEGESRNDFIKRVSTFINSMIEQHNEQSLVIVTHGGVIRAWLSYIIGNDFKLESPKFSHLFRVDNCSVTLVTFIKKQWEISYLNDTNHLKNTLV
jgi:broad specificity phosphatase PhoE